MILYKFTRSPLQLKHSELLLLPSSSVASTTSFQSSLAGTHNAHLLLRPQAINLLTASVI